jgi:predicted membrane protein
MEQLFHVLKEVQGFIYPNEVELHWSVLIVLYPYVTGLVAGAFILASLERVFNVKAVKPTYRLALLTALSFLLVATLPLLTHLGHPERCYEIMFTPNLRSAMAVFGFVYAWYLMVVLLLEIWLDYRKEIVIKAQSERGLKGLVYKLMTLGVYDISEKALAFDDRFGKFITIVGIPSAFLLHGYVGFIFGSIKANPWWSTVLMPVIFLFSAVVSGIAMMGVIYMAACWIRKVPVDMACIDALNKYLFYVLIIDFSLESLDVIHRIYEAEESFHIISMMISGKLFITLVIIQFFIGTLAPLVFLGFIQLAKVKEQTRKVIYFVNGLLLLIGVFAMRWNVVVGGQLFSKSFKGFTTYKLELIGREGLLVASGIFLLPFLILTLLLILLPPWHDGQQEAPNA